MRTESLSKVIAVLERMGYRQVARRGDLVSFDVLTGSGYPIILDESRDTIRLDDLNNQLEMAGVELNVFWEEMQQV